MNNRWEERESAIWIAPKPNAFWSKQYVSRVVHGMKMVYSYTTTLNHIKYCLPNGDSGIIKTIDYPIYIIRVFGNNVFCLDRDGKNKLITVDASEYLFKLSLSRNATTML
jgi:hypothetical protein